MTKRVELAQPLTPAEERVVALLAEGLTYAQVGERLHISPRTVLNHVTNAAAKIPGDLPMQLRVITWYHGGPTWRRTVPRS